MAIIGRVFGHRQRKHGNGRNGLPRVKAEDATAFLRPYGYLACGPRMWEPMQKQVVLSIRITNHAEENKHTQYHVECSLTWPDDCGIHIAHTWGVERRLAHFRLGLHDPVKRELAGSYAKLFHRAHFAQRGGPKGTTSRLNRWLDRLAHVINSRDVTPQTVALILATLELPEAPSDTPCASVLESSPSVCAPRMVPTGVCQLVQLPSAAASVSTSVSVSEGCDSDSDGWSDLGLSDADSLDDVQSGDFTPGRDTEEAADVVDMLPALSTESLALVHTFSEAGINSLGLPEQSSELPMDDRSLGLSEESAEVPDDAGYDNALSKAADESSMIAPLELTSMRVVDAVDCEDKDEPKVQTQLQHVAPEEPGPEAGKDEQVDDKTVKEFASFDSARGKFQAAAPRSKPTRIVGHRNMPLPNSGRAPTF